MAEQTYHSRLRFSFFIMSYLFLYKFIHAHISNVDLTKVKQVSEVFINMVRPIQLSMSFPKQYDP